MSGEEAGGVSGSACWQETEQQWISEEVDRVNIKKLTGGDEKSEILGTFDGISRSSCWATEAVRFREARAVAEEEEEEEEEEEDDDDDDGYSNSISLLASHAATENRDDESGEQSEVEGEAEAAHEEDDDEEDEERLDEEEDLRLTCCSYCIIASREHPIFVNTALRTELSSHTIRHKTPGSNWTVWTGWISEDRRGREAKEDFFNISFLKARSGGRRISNRRPPVSQEAWTDTNLIGNS